MNVDGISLRNVAFGFGDRPVFQSISIHIPKDEIWALVGRSGVGKTTLLQVIAGLFRPDIGAVSVAGRELPARIHGVVFQEESLLGWLTVEQNVLFPHHRHPPPARLAKGRQLLQEAGLSGHALALPNMLSVGMRKRVEVVRAFMSDDSYLLADEPFGTLDPVTRREMWQIWQTLRHEQPRTGILSTHDPEEALRLADVVVSLIPSSPAYLGSPFRVPQSVAKLSATENSEELTTYKERLIVALSG